MKLRMSFVMSAVVVMSSLVLAHAPSAEAAVTLTTPAMGIAVGNVVTCAVSNVSATNLSMRVQFIDATGNVEWDPYPGGFTLSAGDTTLFNLSFSTPEWIRCKFIGGGTNKANFKGTIQRDSGSTSFGFVAD
jgi:hypothetical protein